jgi:hypothetical protein
MRARSKNHPVDCSGPDLYRLILKTYPAAIFPVLLADSWKTIATTAKSSPLNYIIQSSDCVGQSSTSSLRYQLLVMLIVNEDRVQLVDKTVDNSGTASSV